VWLQLGRKSKVQPVPGGREEKRKCPECDKTGTFVEVTVKKTYTAYVLVNLFDTESTSFMCKACKEIMDLDATLTPELSPREQAEAERAKARAEAERKATLEAAADKARAEAAEREEALDDELAAMKARLGLD
jgi:predicted nucleic-acid-binding Zn-ribbon protein